MAEILAADAARIHILRLHSWVYCRLLLEAHRGLGTRTSRPQKTNAAGETPALPGAWRRVQCIYIFCACTSVRSAVGS